MNMRNLRAKSLASFNRASAILAVAGLAGTAVADPVLEISTPSLTTNLMPSTAAGQDVKPLAIQRGVGIDGGLRAGSTMGWGLAAHAGNDPAAGNRALAGVTLATGAPMLDAVDMALPSAGPRWVVGRTYNSVQTSDGLPTGTHDNSDGYQGMNWFQSSQPEISVYVDTVNHANDVVYLVYGADRYIEFARTSSSSTEYKAKNGAAGVVQYVSGSPDTWVYTDQLGNQTTFFGGNTSGGAADWQFWKMADEAGNTIYVGDKTTAGTAVANGYSGKRITTAYDQADRRYSYTYATIDSVVRLTQVEAETRTGGTWASPTGLATVGQVDYEYYQSTDNAEGDNGCLKLVTVTTPLSDTSITSLSKTMYRYYKGTYHATTNLGSSGQVKMVLGAEGARKYDWDLDGSLDDDFIGATTADLKVYSSAYFTYYDVLDSDTFERARVASAFFNGQCGCSGSANGEYAFEYSLPGSFTNTSGYDTAWARRVIVTEPSARWTTQYVDEVGGSLSRVLTDAHPSSASNHWSTEVVRDSSGLVTELHTPASISGYTHSGGTFTRSTSNGLIWVYIRETNVASDYFGFITSSKFKKLDSESNASAAILLSTTTWTSEAKTIGTAEVRRPSMADTYRYGGETPLPYTYPSNEAMVVSRTAYSSSLSDKVRSVDNPRASTAENGSNAATVQGTSYLRKDRTAAFTVNPDGVTTYTQIDSRGLVTKRIVDAQTNHGSDFASGEDPNTDFGITETGAGDRLISTFTYDEQGRHSTVTAPDGLVTQSFLTRLGDGRLVRLSVPRVTTGGTTTYYSPVGYTVTNMAGQVEFQATVAFSGGSTTSAITTWIDEADANPLTALDVGTISKLSASVYSVDGQRLEQSRSYFAVPGSWPGTEGTDYDATRYGYDNAGRQLRVKQASGTISRTVLDAMGRVTESWSGTNDNSWTLPDGEASGSNNMTKTEVREYDAGLDAGNSLLTTLTRDPDGNWNNTGTGGNPPDDRRITTYAYDVRGRLILTTNPVAPHSVTKYNNKGQVLATGAYSSASGLSASTDPTSTTTNRIGLSETAYDEPGKAYKTTAHKINTSTGASDDTVVTNTWYDASGRVMKVQGSSISKTKYDRHGRATHQFVIGKTDDTAAGGGSAYSDAGTVTGDTVMEEHQSIYDVTTGLTFFSVSLMRAHDDTSTTGAIDGNGDATLSTLTVGSGNVIATTTRISINAIWYDAMRRPTASAAYGTNGSGNANTFTRPGSVPGSPTFELVSSTTYADDGTVLESTDPRGLKSRTVLDAAGRTIKTIRNYTDGTPGGGTNNDQDQTIEYGYSKGFMTTYTAKMPGGTDQVTTYIFGTTKGTSAGLSAVATGHMLRATKYPDTSNSGTTVANIDSSAADVLSHAYNTLGQEILRQDQAGNVTETTYDSGGRTTIRAVTTLISGFDGAVRRVETGYDSRGRTTTVTQYTAATSGSIVDEVKHVYDDWGNITNFQQDRNSAVSSAGGTAGYHEVVYAFTKATPTGGGIVVRPTTITLPSGQEYDLDYGTANGVNDCLSRVDTVKSVTARSPTYSAVTLAEYDYLGTGMVVGTALPEPAALNNLFDSTATADYDRLDGFNRVTRSVWNKSATTSRFFYDVTLTYDNDSNIVSAEDNVLVGYDAKYDMDGLNRLIVADEGTLTTGSFGTRTRKETWGLNQVGGWATFTSDLNGDGSFSSPAFGPTDEKNETRTFNTVNELSTRVNNSVTKSPAFNANGQQTDDGVNYEYVWDAFGRLTKVTTRGGSPATVVEYKYNGLNMQIGRHADLDADADVDSSDKWEWFVYDPRWRRVATIMVAGGTDLSGSADASMGGVTYIKERYVHHAAGRLGRGSYIDSVILRDRDQTNGNNGASDGTMEGRLYYCQNWRSDVSVTMTSTGRILEWFKYSAYGVVQRIPTADYNHDTFVDFFDDGDFATDHSNGATVADINYDGTTDSTDDSEWNVTYPEQGFTVRGVLAENGASAPVNRIGYTGYFFEPSTQQYLVRHREFDSNTGVWDERDPLGFHDGADLYMYAKDAPITRKDPMGLISRNGSCGGRPCSGAASGKILFYEPLDDSGLDVDRTCGRQVLETCLADPLYGFILLDLLSTVWNQCGRFPIVACCKNKPGLGGPCSSGTCGYTECPTVRAPSTQTASCLCVTDFSSPNVQGQGGNCNRENNCTVLLHELVHQYQCCRGPRKSDGGRPEGTDVARCREIGAYYFAGPCAGMSKNDFCDCMANQVSPGDIRGYSEAYGACLNLYDDCISDNPYTPAWFRKSK